MVTIVASCDFHASDFHSVNIVDCSLILKVWYIQKVWSFQVLLDHLIWRLEWSGLFLELIELFFGWHCFAKWFSTVWRGMIYTILKNIVGQAVKVVMIVSILRTLSSSAKIISSKRVVSSFWFESKEQSLILEVWILSSIGSRECLPFLKSRMLSFWLLDYLMVQFWV